MNCKYPTCHATELNEDGLCKNHEVNYGKKKTLGGGFDLKRIQDGLKKMAEKAPPHIKTHEEKLQDRVKEVQESLL